jgi:hypothetical protein
MGPLLTAWLVEMGLITYRGAKQGKFATNPIPHLALPSEYVASFIIYGGLALVPEGGQRVAAAVGWGLVVATFLNLWDPTTVGNKGGVAVIGGPSTKTAANPSVVSPTNLSPVNPQVTG